MVYIDLVRMNKVMKRLVFNLKFSPWLICFQYFADVNYYEKNSIIFEKDIKDEDDVNKDKKLS